MAAFSIGKCDVCKEKFHGELVQTVSRTCEQCNAQFQICCLCAMKGCPKCGGKLVSALDEVSRK